MRRKTFALVVGALALSTSMAIAPLAPATHETVQRTSAITGSFVPTYSQCLPPDRTVRHANPIELNSCPVTSSRDTSPLLMPKPYAADDSGFKSQFIQAVKTPSNTFGSADVVDLKLATDANGVLCETAAVDPSGQNGWVHSSIAAARCPSGAGGPYSGNVVGAMAIWLTDADNCPSFTPCPDGTGHATVSEFRMSYAIPCTSGNCNVLTSWDAQFGATYSPSIDPTVNGKRADFEVRSILIQDPGGNADFGTGCPLTCGDGDEHDAFGLGVFIR